MGSAGAISDEGHSFYTKPALNSASVVYICILVIYTGMLIYCLTMLFRYRRHHSVKVRGYGITFAAVLAIHFYVAALFVVYPLNEDFKCGTEFWIMSTALPLGMALFQACNFRLWSYSKLQNELAEMSCFSKKKREPISLTAAGLKKWFSRRDSVQMTYFWIGVGLIVQVALTFFLFFGSRRFSPSAGFFGQHVGRTTCRRGYEWIPSVVWQFLWTWIIGPIVLYKTREIKDTHFWALQTRLCVIGGLPGTPLWLCFLYISSPATAKINPWWPPAMWFAPGLMTMCLSSVLLPGYDIYRRALRSNSSEGSSSSLSLSDNQLSHQSKQLVHSFPAFEFQLKRDPQRLLDYAQTKDFTAENILFLWAVREFKLKWRRHISMSPSINDCLSDLEIRAMYEHAACLYFQLINPRTAFIGLNLDSDMFEQLELIFSHLDYELPTDVHGGGESGEDMDRGLRSIIAPWEAVEAAMVPASGPENACSQHSNESETAIINIGFVDRNELPSRAMPPICQLLGLSIGEFERIRAQNASRTMSRAEEIESSHWEGLRMATAQIEEKSAEPVAQTDLIPELVKSLGNDTSRGPSGKIISRPNGSHLTRNPNFVPGAFSLNVFDKAYQHIIYLVYHNTWKSYINHLDRSGIRRLAVAYTNRDNMVARRHSPWSHMTDAELFDLNLELEAERDGTDVNQIHHGVLDLEKGPMPMSQADARCSACRHGSREDRIKHIIGLDPDHSYMSGM